MGSVVLECLVDRMEFVDCSGLLLVVLECSDGQQGLVSLDQVG